MEQDERNIVVIGNDEETLFSGLHIEEKEHEYIELDNKCRR